MNDRISFRSAVAAQPEALRKSHAAVSRQLDAIDFAAMKGKSLALVGIGASLYAAQAGAAQMRAQGLRAHALVGTDLYDSAVDAADIYVALSASGRSVEPAKAVELRPRAATIGIAKTAASPLTAVVGTMIATESGPDSGPNTTSYLGSLQAVGLLADRLGHASGENEWTSLPDTVSSLLEDVSDAVDRAAAMLKGRISLDCVGAGVACGTAGYAALLVREAVRMPAQGWDTLNFLHGPMEPNDGRTGVVLFGARREVKLASDLADFGIPTLLVTADAGIGDKSNLVVLRVSAPKNALCEAVLHAVPVQLLMQKLAEDAGMPECVFRYRQTDTKLDVKTAA